MNRAFSPFVKSLFVALMAASAFATASDAAKPAHAEAPAVVKADAAKGAKLFAEGNPTTGLPACLGCHGVAGNSAISVNPKLAGQPEAYIYKQLVNFTTPERSNPVMTAFSSMMSDQDKKDVAAYLSTQKQEPGESKNKDTLALGKKIYRGGIAEKSVAACAGCHGPAGAGMPAQYPRIGGQHQDYAVAQLTAFRSAARKNSTQMTTIAKRMSDEEINAVADYIAGLK
jgi:cytochrome c553